MELGVAGMMGVKQFSGDGVDDMINEWLNANADAEVIDIKFSSAAASENYSQDALIIYRKENR